MISHFQIKKSFSVAIGLKQALLLQQNALALNLILFNKPENALRP